MSVKKIIAITGPRKITPEQAAIARPKMLELIDQSEIILVGDATGIDEIAQQLAPKDKLLIFVKDQKIDWRYRPAERSERMVRALRQYWHGSDHSVELHGWPSTPCPKTLRMKKHAWPSQAKSGTWGTIAMIKSYGMGGVLHPIGKIYPLPEWISKNSPWAEARGTLPIENGKKYDKISYNLPMKAL